MSMRVVSLLNLSSISPSTRRLGLYEVHLPQSHCVSEGPAAEWSVPSTGQRRQEELRICPRTCPSRKNYGVAQEPPTSFSTSGAPT